MSEERSEEREDDRRPCECYDGEGIDIDDALIQEPKDDAFKKVSESEKPAKRQRKKA